MKSGANPSSFSNITHLSCFHAQSSVAGPPLAHRTVMAKYGIHFLFTISHRDDSHCKLHDSWRFVYVAMVTTRLAKLRHRTSNTKSIVVLRSQEQNELRSTKEGIEVVS